MMRVWAWNGLRSYVKQLTSINVQFIKDTSHHLLRDYEMTINHCPAFNYSTKRNVVKIKTHGTVDVWRNITIQELAKILNRDVEEIEDLVLRMPGYNDVNPSTCLEDMKNIREIAMKCGMKSKFIAAPTNIATQVPDNKERDITPRPPAPVENLKPRPPIVTIMGHVDHGKTTLLDTLRSTSVTEDEAGGITQHIGAFTLTLDSGEKITFIDTPGHAAFSAMRARGANLTDIIVLVVAADDGVMEQTREVIKLAYDAKVPIIVAINKIDKPQADIDRTKKELIRMGLALEDSGGDIQVVPISALKGTNLKDLTEAITTQAVLMELKSEDTGLMEGVVVESKTDMRRGKLSTAIVTRGTLKKGCILVSGLAWAKVRALFDDKGNTIDKVTPGNPVEILGWRELPIAGDIILEVPSEKKAHSVIKYRETMQQEEKAKEDLEMIKKKEEEHNEKYISEREARRLSGRYRARRQIIRPKENVVDNHPRVNLILKGDVHGSVEAILDVLETYNSNDKCKLDVVHYGVGDVTENDIELAKAFNAIIYAFNVNTLSKIKTDVRIRKFNIIYRLVDDLKQEISSKLEPTEVEEIIGEATVLQAFFINEGRKEIPVAGSRCIKGLLRKSAKFKLIRNEEILFDGTLDSMRHLKNEVDVIKKDVECGLKFNGTVVPQNGDKIICYTTHIKPQTTDWDPGF